MATWTATLRCGERPEVAIPLPRHVVRIGLWFPERTSVPSIGVAPGDDPDVSSHHARLFPRGQDRWLLADDGSRCGTVLDDGPRLALGITAEVGHGSVIRVGRHTRVALTCSWEPEPRA